MAAILSDEYIFLNENYRNPIQISLKFVPRSPINNKPVLVKAMLALNNRQIITWTNDADVQNKISVVTLIS